MCRCHKNNNFFVFLEDKVLFCLILFSQVIGCTLEQSIQTEWIFLDETVLNWRQNLSSFSSLLSLQSREEKICMTMVNLTKKPLNLRIGITCFQFCTRSPPQLPRLHHNFRFDQQLKQRAKV